MLILTTMCAFKEQPGTQKKQQIAKKSLVLAKVSPQYFCENSSFKICVIQIAHVA